MSQFVTSVHTATGVLGRVHGDVMQGVVKYLQTGGTRGVFL